MGAKHALCNGDCNHLVRPCVVTTTTDGRTHISAFDREGRNTSAEEHITLAPDGSVESQWSNAAGERQPPANNERTPDAN
jgi:polyribonucleotide nucleotidyltransferase